VPFRQQWDGYEIKTLEDVGRDADFFVTGHGLFAM
jgi:S-adenosylhomocysteine hydrolase